MEIKSQGSDWVFETPQAHHMEVWFGSKGRAVGYDGLKSQVRGEQSLTGRPNLRAS